MSAGGVGCTAGAIEVEGPATMATAGVELGEGGEAWMVGGEVVRVEAPIEDEEASDAVMALAVGSVTATSAERKLIRLITL